MTLAERTLAPVWGQVPAGRTLRSTAIGRLATAASAVVVTGSLVAALAVAATPSDASSVSTLKAKAAAIAGELNAESTKLQILSEEYDQARTQVGGLDAKIGAEQRKIDQTRRSVAHDTAALRSEAVTAYVDAGSSTDFAVVMASSANKLPLQQAYLQTASATITTTITSLNDAQHELTVREATLEDAQVAASRNEATIDSAKQQAQQISSQLDSTESQVQGQLAVAVRQQELAEARRQAQIAAEQAAATRAAAAVARQAQAAQKTDNATLQSPSSGSSATASSVAPPATAPAAPSTPINASGGGAGEVAVRAAMSQIGVPYVWGGATPGVGFDCSGLAMWAWEQAGVSLPHSAQDQYDEIEHVSMSELQPGDLIFYASGGYVYHVIMYIGGGQAVQAEETGTRIQVTPVWPGAYGAGRP